MLDIGKVECEAQSFAWYIPTAYLNCCEISEKFERILADSCFFFLCACQLCIYYEKCKEIK